MTKTFMAEILDFNGQKVKKEQKVKEETTEIEIFGSGVYDNSSAQTLILNLLTDIHKYLDSFLSGELDRQVGETKIDDNFKINAVAEIVVTYPFAFTTEQVNVALQLLELSIEDLKEAATEEDTYNWIIIDVHQENLIKLSKLLKQRLIREQVEKQETKKD